MLVFLYIFHVKIFVFPTNKFSKIGLDKQR